MPVLPDVATWLLVGLRILPACLLVSVAIFRAPRVLGSLAFAMLLSAALWPLAPPVPAAARAGLPALSAGVRELLVGSGFALAAGSPLLALAWTGALIDRAREGHGANPPCQAVARLSGLLGLAVFFAVGGHRLALRVFADSLRLMPPSATGDGSFGLPALLALSGVLGTAFGWALMWAAPVLVSLLVLDLGLATVQRFSRALPVAVIAAPARTLGVLALVLAVSVLWVEGMPAAIEAALRVARGLW